MERSVILNSKKVIEYLNNIDNKGTRGQYTVQLVDFFQWLNKHPDEYVKDCELLRIDNPTEEIKYKRIVEKDIRDYYKSFDKRLHRYGRTYAPLRRMHNVYTVKNFFEFHHTELSKRFWQDFKKKHNGASIIIEDISPTQEQVQKIIQMGDVREKAVILCQISSGCRIGELLDIRLKDLHWNDFERYGVLIVEIRSDNKGNKTRKSRITFFSSEAIEYLNVWLERERVKHLQLSVNKSKNFKEFMKGEVKDDDRVFPFTSKSWRDNTWNKLLKHTGMDWKDNIGHYKFRTHSLRKYFKKKAGKYDIQLMNQLIGHGGFERRYSDITDKEEFCNEIKKLEEYVTIKEYVSGETREQVEQIQNQLINKDEQIKKLEETLKIMELRMQGLENKIEIEKLKNGNHKK
jgi:integrase